MANRKINITFTIPDDDLIELSFRSTIIGIVGKERLIDYVNFPNTEHLKDNDTFKKLLKAKRDAGRELDRFINNNRNN